MIARAVRNGSIGACDCQAITCSWWRSLPTLLRILCLSDKLDWRYLYSSPSLPRSSAATRLRRQSGTRTRGRTNLLQDLEGLWVHLPVGIQLLRHVRDVVNRNLRQPRLLQTYQLQYRAGGSHMFGGWAFYFNPEPEPEQSRGGPIVSCSTHPNHNIHHMDHISEHKCGGLNDARPS